ncbi:MAG TPA: ImmA/IrrE family metallo-endopeptidase [Mycobacteriales bacterium]|nr:ImmA/IrrE family metallo-endopeptidase [Mycobacteriales bacterium]
MGDTRDQTPVSRVAARERAADIVAALTAADPALVTALQSSPLAALRGRPDLEVRFVPESQTDAGCSVSGAYLGDITPVVLAVADTAVTGHEAFTLLHEFGHHLQQTDLDRMAELLDQPDGGHGLEDATCDAFASAVLLPDGRLAEHLGAGVTASAVVRLWTSSPASRAAVAVRAAERLPAPGHVLVLDPDGTVRFAAAHGLPPVGRGSDQSRVDVIRDALSRDSWRATGRTRFVYRDGIRGDELYVQTGNIGGYMVVVAVTDHAAWERFAPTSRSSGPVARSWTCEHDECGHMFRTFDRSCARCGSPHCPACGRCNCAPAVEELCCDGCFLVLPASMFTGSGTRCRDCS